MLPEPEGAGMLSGLLTDWTRRPGLVLALVSRCVVPAGRASSGLGGDGGAQSPAMIESAAPDDAISVVVETGG